MAGSGAGVRENLRRVRHHVLYAADYLMDIIACNTIALARKTHRSTTRSSYAVLSLTRALLPRDLHVETPQRSCVGPCRLNHHSESALDGADK
jgi:hypothetical protein